MCCAGALGSLTILTWRQSATYTDVETWTPSSVYWSHSAKSVGTACDGRALVDLAASTRPDVIVLDISMPQRQSIILRGSGAQL
jgi:CheY-like chemotaxis protein